MAKKTKVDIVRWIGRDFLLENIDRKTRTKKVELTSDITDTLPILEVRKTFKVKNYNENVQNYIMKNMEIEIEWKTDYDMSFWKQMIDFFK